MPTRPPVALRALSTVVLAVSAAAGCARPAPDVQPPPPPPAAAVPPAAPAPVLPPSAPPRPRPPAPTLMTCGGETVAIVDDGSGSVRVTVAGTTHVLTPTPAASGARFDAEGDGATVFWSKGAVATLQVDGRVYPECTMHAAETLVALGHEPGWQLEIGDGVLTLVVGQTRVSAPTPYAEAFEGGRRYITSSAGRTITATLLDRVCADSATGMPKPMTAHVDFAGRTLRGCGGDTMALLRGAPWVVQAIDGANVARGSRVTIVFGDDERLTGTASCNSYSAAYALTGEGVTVGPATTTFKACPPAVMKQEAAFLAALDDVTRLEVTDDGTLVLHTAKGQRVTSRRQ